MDAGIVIWYRGEQVESLAITGPFENDGPTHYFAYLTGPKAGKIAKVTDRYLVLNNVSRVYAPF